MNIDARVVFYAGTPSRAFKLKSGIKPFSLVPPSKKPRRSKRLGPQVASPLAISFCLATRAETTKFVNHVKGTWLEGFPYHFVFPNGSSVQGQVCVDQSAYLADGTIVLVMLDQPAYSPAAPAL